MSVNVGSAVAYLDLDSSKFEKGLEKSKSSLSKIEKAGAGFTKTGMLLTAGLTLPITAFGVASVKAADALRQTQRKSEVIFGDMTKDVQAWSLENERTFGLGAGTIEQYTGQIADLTQGMGLGKKESLAMAQGAMELGVQLGNWNGVGADVAMEDLTAAISGTHKAVEKYGVKLNQTVLDEKTRAMGLGDTFNKLTEAQKAEVRYQAIIEASGNAVEFWNEGNRSTAFYLNEIKEQVGNVMEVVGGIFLPILDKVVKVMADWVSKMAAFAAENPKIVEGVVMLGGALALLGPGVAIIGKLMTIFAAGTTAATGLLAVAVGAAIAGTAFVGLNESASQALLELPNKAHEAIQGFLQTIVDNLPLMLEKGLEMMFKFLEGLALGVPVLLQFMADSIGTLVKLVFEFAPQFLMIGIEFIKKMIDGAIEKFPQFWQNMMDGILKVLQNIREKMPEFMARGVEFVGKMAEGLWNNLPTIIAKTGELIAKVIGKIVEYLPKFLAEGIKIVGEMAKGLWNNRNEIITMIGTVITGLWNSAIEAVKAFLNVGKSIVDNMKQGVANAWGSFVGWISGKMKSIPLIGKFFSLEMPQEEDLSQDIMRNNLTRVKFDYDNKLLKSGQIATDLASIFNPFGDFDPKNKPKPKGGKEIPKTGDININVNVDKMMNTDNRSIESIADELAFYIKRKRLI